MDLKIYSGKEREQVTITSRTGLSKPVRPNPSKPCDQIPTTWPDVNPRLFHSFIWDVCDKAETENGDQYERAQTARLKNNGVLETRDLNPRRALSQKGSGEGSQPKAEKGKQGP
jgi:hypothetical protein